MRCPPAPEIHDDLQEIVAVGVIANQAANVLGEHLKKGRGTGSGIPRQNDRPYPLNSQEIQDVKPLSIEHDLYGPNNVGPAREFPGGKRTQIAT